VRFVLREGIIADLGPREDTRNDTKELRGSRGANNRHAGFFMLVFVCCVAKVSRLFQVHLNIL